MSADSAPLRAVAIADEVLVRHGLTVVGVDVDDAVTLGDIASGPRESPAAAGLSPKTPESGPAAAAVAVAASDPSTRLTVGR